MIRERSRLVSKLLETRQHCAELEQQLCDERERVQSLSTELDRQLAECDQLCGRLSSAESLNRSLQAEVNQLQSVTHPSTVSVASGLQRPTQSPYIMTSAPDLHHRPVTHTHTVVTPVQCMLSQSKVLGGLSSGSTAVDPRETVS